MKKIFTLTGFFVLIALSCFSQSLTNYSLTSTSGTFTLLSGATVPTGSGTVDEGNWNAIPIGFNFWYMGTRYTTVSASTNGWLALGANITNSTYANNLSSGGAPRPVLAPLWDDLDVQSWTNVSYLTSGTAGSRIFTLQFLNNKWSYTASGNTISFQVKLYEGTGKIEYVYRQESGAVAGGSASIGLSATGTGNGNFLSLNGTGTSPSASSSNEKSNINSKPATGQSYAFTSPIATAPTALSYTSITTTAMTLNWADNATNESGYVIYGSTDGVNYSFYSQTASNTTSSVQSGLSGNTTYYWKVYALTEGAFSTALSGSRITACTPPAAPVVTSTVNYCLNATASALTATGANLLWGGSSLSGAAGGTSSTLTTPIFVDGVYSTNNRKTNFTTTTANVTITTVDYYIPVWQSVNGIVLAIFDNSGTIVATSSTTTTQTAGAAALRISNTFNYLITTAGNYSIGIASGSGNIGSDNPSYPITETTGTINVTGVSVAGYHCFNNLQFTTGAGTATAPTPLTSTLGSTNYIVTQTVSGCLSPQATITVNITAPNISQIPVTNLIGNYPFSGNADDVTGNNDGALQNAPTLTADRFSVAGKAYALNGSSQYISTSNFYDNPTNFTVSIWFKTATTTGGKLIGFGISQTGGSTHYDRHIYMTNAGELYFGVYPGVVKTVQSTLSYNDNRWHLATATLSATTGMALYVDGALVGSNASATSAENYIGYWRIGYDNVNGWTSQPTSLYFNGSLDDALIYDRALSASEVNTLYVSPDGAGSNGPVCAGSAVTLSATTIGSATYLWTGPNSYTSSSQNPSFNYSAAAAGVYTLKVTVAGCTATAYTLMSGTANDGQWTGNTSTDWLNADNWCSGTVPSATTNVIITSGATRMPAIGGSASCNSLTINSGASLTISVAGTLNIAGTLTNNGTLTNGGTTNFNGTSGQQTFTGTSSFYNLTLNNSAGLLLPSAITVNNNLLITAGTLNANNFAVTVKGNWTNNAATTAFTAGTGIITFSGSTAQVIGGSFSTTFNNCILANTTTAVTLGVNTSIAGNLTVSSGIFDLAGFTANRSTAGGVLTVSNNATLKIGGTNSFPINYTTNTLVVASTVEYAGTNQTISNQTYGNLQLSSASGAAVKTLPGTPLTIIGNLTSTIGTGTAVSFTAAANITVSGNISIGASTTFNGSSYIDSIGGNWVNSGIFNGNTGKVVFTGSGKTVSGAGTQNFNDLTVAASLVSFANGTINLSGNLATTGSGSFSQVTGGTLVMTGTGTTISGSGIALDNLTVSGTVSTAVSVNVTGNLTVSGSFTSTAGTIILSGASKTIAGAGTKSFGILSVTGSISTAVDFSISSSLTVAGSMTASAGTATFTGTATLSGTANLYNTIINGTSLQLSASSVLGIAGGLTITSGILNVTASRPNTVNFNSSGAQNINAITYDNLSISNGNSKTAIAALTINGNITIGVGTTFISGAYTHSVYNDWTNYGSFTAGSGTVQFLGNQNTTLTGATTFNVLTVNGTTSATAVVLQDDVSATTVNMTMGEILTGTKTLTITGTRTGPGIILGNILRTHTFLTGVNYAFEGPDNTINFSSATSVTSVKVSVALGSINDFPFGGSISRVYTVDIPAGTYNATLRLHYEDNELNGSNESSMGLWNYNGTAWAAAGKTGNNTTSNYVELSGLTNITNRWTCSDNSNVVKWNGSVSSDWSTAANWTVQQGSASTPPAATDIVNLGTATFTNNPTISSTVAVKNIHFGSAQAVTLSLASGGSLTSGDIQGNWNSAVTHTINANNQVVTINGDLVLDDGVAGHSINLAIGTGTVSITGSLIQTAGSSVVFSGAGNLNISKDHTYTSGTFTPGAGTVTYNGLTNQVIGAVTYNNLAINKAAGAAINNSLTISGNLSVIAGELDNFATTTILGNVTISSGAILHNHAILHVGGNWNNSGTYSASGTATNVIFDGTGTQTVSATTFNNLEINKPVGTRVELTGDVTLRGNLVGTSGTLDIKSFFFNRDVVGGSATLSDSGTLVIGADNAPTLFSNYYLAPHSTIVFDGAATQHLLLPGVVYGNLTFRNAGTKILYTAIQVNGDLTIESGATFDGNSSTITLNGHWLNSGTFTPSTSTVVCTGIAKNISGNTTFNKMTVPGSYTFLNNVTLNGLLNITSSGSLSGGGTILTTLHGDLINSGILYTLGTTTFSGNALQTLSLINAVQTVALIVNFNGSVSPVLNSTSPAQYGYLNINNTGGVNPSMGWTILYALNVNSGATFNGGLSTHNILGNVTNNGTMTSTGTLNFIPSSAVTVNTGSNFTSTGTVIFGGAGALTLAGTPVALNNVVISNTNGQGITPSSAWNITNNLTVNSGAILNAGSYSHLISGNILNNGTINSGSSTITMNGAGAQTISNPSAFNNLTINKAAGSVTLVSNGTVNGAMNFIAGGITTGNYLLIQPSTGTITGAAQNTGWVNGKLQKNIATGATIKSFEVGDATNYTPVSLAFSTVATAGNITAFTTPGEHPAINSSVINAAKSVNRYWTLANSGVVFDQYSANFHFSASDIDAGADTASFSTSLYNGSSWILPVTTAITATSIQASGITAPGDFSIGEICNSGTAISYPASPYCTNSGTATVTLTGNGGGVFSSSTGLSINSSTGTVNLSTSVPGSYLVTYTIAATGGCATYLTSATINVSGAASATISYAASPYCSSAGTAQVSFAGTSGGTFTSTTGLSLNSATGEINLAASTSGTYTVTYSVAGVGGCSTYTTTANITITTQPFANGTYTGNPYCSNSGTAFPTGTFTGASGILTSTAGLSIDSLTGVVNLAASTPGNYVVTHTVAAYAGCGVYTNNTTINIVAPGTWTGAVSNDWNDSGNWLCGQIPATNTSITIPGSLSIYPVVTGTSSVNNVTVQSGGNLLVSGGTLQVAGAISNAGLFDVSAGTIEMNGATPQTIPANAFSNNSILNLVVNNNVTLGGQDTIKGTLTIGSSNITFATGNYLSLKSNAAGSAKIAPLPVNGSGVATSYITGNVTIERYIPSRRSWRLVTAPVSNTGSVFSTWQNGGVYAIGKGMFVTGPGPQPSNGLDASAQNSVSLKTFSTTTQAFVNVTNTKTTNLSGTSSTAANIGYFAFIRGDRDPANLHVPNTNSTTLRSAGILQTGKQTFNASATYNYYTIIGNPYASPVDFSLVQRTHLLKRFYAWDATINGVGAYVILDDIDGDGTYSKSPPSSSQTKIIQSGQALFVLTDTAGAASLTFNETSKSTVVSNAGFRPSGLTKSLEITLNLLEADNSTTVADGTLAEFNDAYCACVNMEDAVKFTNTNETFSFQRNNTSLAIERRPVIIAEDTMFLKLVQSSQRSYQLYINAVNLSQPGLVAVLEDKFTGTTNPVNLDGATAVAFTITSNAASSDANRFRIVFKKAVVLPVSFVEVSAKLIDKNVNVQWVVEHQQNIRQYEIERSQDGIHFTTVGTQLPTANGATTITYNWLDKQTVPGNNYYRIRNLDLDGKSAYSKIVEVSIANPFSLISVYPNPVLDGVIGLQFHNRSAGKYIAKLFNSKGQQVFVKTFRHVGGNATEQLILSTKTAKGTYELVISDPGDNKTIIQVIIQ